MSLGLVPKPDTKRSLEAATQAYHAQARNDQEFWAYLESRKITKEAVDYFRLGIVRTPQDGHESYAGRISIPYVTPTGVVTMRFRYPGDDHPKKLLGMPDEPARLFNTRALLGAREVYICEGEPDTIIAWQAGLAAVGIPGANTWKSNSRVWTRVLANRKVTVLADADDSGIGLELAKDIYSSLGGCRIIQMPNGHDVNSFVIKEGEDEFKALLASRPS